MPNVNPDILKWARETAGLSVEEAVKKLGMSGETAVDRLTALEEGGRAPTRPMLVKMSEKYRRPLLTFYLLERPQESDKGQDFRTLLEEPQADQEALLNVLLRNVHTRQDMVRAALEEAEEDDELPFVGSARIEDGVDAAVASLRETLGVSLEDFRQQGSVGDAFKVLRAGAESAGVFVLLMGNLGTHHTDIDARVFRGFALADPVAPFVVINETDSLAAWSFTLLHELTHVWLGQTAISGYNGEAQVERFCDRVASRFLLGPQELVQIGAPQPEGLGAYKLAIDDFAGERNVSRKMVAYNLLSTGTIDGETYRQLCDIFDAERAQQKGGGGGSGPDYYVVRRHRVGPALVDFVRRMVAGGELSTTEAGRVLGVKPTSVGRLVDTEHAA